MANYLARKKPRQLHIVDDTELARDFENLVDLSTKRQEKNLVDLSTSPKLENLVDLSTAMKRIERRRKELGLSVQRLARLAGIHPYTYWSGRKGSAPVRATTINKLQAALARHSGGEKPEAARALCAVTIRLMTAHLAREIGADPSKVLAANFDAENTNDPDWLQASRLRRAAIYIVVEGVRISKADVANAIGVSRQAVHKSVAKVELARDENQDFDRLMAETMARIAGWK